MQCEVHIYPNLKLEGKQIAHFLNRGAIGIHAQPQIGKGREFEKLREYERGDSFDEINWKATAKRRFPVTKVFQLERSKEIYLALDTSRLSARQLPEIIGNSTFPQDNDSSRPCDLRGSPLLRRGRAAG